MQINKRFFCAHKGTKEKRDGSALFGLSWQSEGRRSRGSSAGNSDPTTPGWEFGETLRIVSSLLCVTRCFSRLSWWLLRPGADPGVGLTREALTLKGHPNLWQNSNEKMKQTGRIIGGCLGSLWVKVHWIIRP